MKDQNLISSGRGTIATDVVQSESFVNEIYLYFSLEQFEAVAQSLEPCGAELFV